VVQVRGGYRARTHGGRTLVAPDPRAVRITRVA